MFDSSSFDCPKKNSAVKSDVETLLKRAELESVHDVQNVVLLCYPCHKKFDTLQLHVDFESIEESCTYYVHIMGAEENTSDVEWMNSNQYFIN